VSIYDRIGGKPMGMFTLTLPRALCDAVGVEHIRPLHGLVQSTITRWARATLGARLGAATLLHPAGHNAVPWRPHFHVIFSTFALDDHGIPFELRSEDVEGAIAHLGDKWADGVRGVASARRVEAGWPRNVHFAGPVEAPAERLELAVYAGRSFPEWSASPNLPRRVMGARWFGLLGGGSQRDSDVRAWRDTVETDFVLPCSDCADVLT
jgi:hypothetical protein